MKLDAIRELARAKPFKPFVLKLAEGSRITVGNAAWIAFSPKGSTLAVYKSDESFKIIEVATIAEVETSKRSNRKT
ncbi:MAG TPA: hypothetical protein VGE41_03070 [Verrucomicrobiae bacterium]